VRLARVHRVRKGERVLCYHRVTRARLPDLPEGHPEFLRAWLAEEERGEPAPKAADMAPGSIGRAVNDYLDGRDLADVSPGYRAAVRRHLLGIDARLQRAALSDLGARHIRREMEGMEGSIALARHKAWRRFLAWCLRTGRLEEDPSASLKRPRQAAVDGHVPWSADDLAAFRARWPIGTAPRAAMELLNWTGARVGDARRLAPGMVRDGILTYRQGKTRSEAHVPWTSALPAFARPLDADRRMMHAALAPFEGLALLILPTESGEMRTAKGFSNTLNDAAREAGLTKRVAHGLRKTRLTALAEAGASVHQIAAWGGHLTLAEVEHYTRAADRRRAVAGDEPVNVEVPFTGAAESGS
jgi:integrase/recombinase XerD